MFCWQRTGWESKAITEIAQRTSRRNYRRLFLFAGYTLAAPVFQNLLLTRLPFFTTIAKSNFCFQGRGTIVAHGKRLGRGLEALLGRVGVSPEPESFHTGEVSQSGTSEERTAIPGSKIDITKIEPNPFQPRKVFDEAELEQLAQSLSTHGLLTPIALRKVGERYQIIAGERRFRSALRLGWSEIPAQIHEVDDRQMAELALTENIQRKDLNAIEKAVSFANYLEVYGCTHAELAKRLEIDRSTVANLIRLLELPQQLQDAVCRKQLSAGHARALLALPEWERTGIAEKVQAEEWSVRETEKFVHDLTKLGHAELPRNSEGKTWSIVGPDGEKRTISPQSEQMLQLEAEFRNCLGGMKVKLVQTNDKGKGKLVITFANHTEFEQIYAALCKQNRAVG
jgi:ParB family chromosome partitioning protein